MRSNHRHQVVLAFAPVLALVLAGTATAQGDPYLPTASFTSPYQVRGQGFPAVLSRVPIFNIHADDADGAPAAYRWIIERAILPDGAYADSRLEAVVLFADLLRFEGAGWSSWQDWPAGEPQARIELPELPEFDDQSRRIFYLLAIQVMDDAGAVQVAQVYGGNVAHFWVADLAPVLTVFEARLGDTAVAGPNNVADVDVVAGTYEFVFGASGVEYGGEVTGLRWGWDLLDPDDPDDPGWDGPASPALSTTGPLEIVSGIHTLTIQAEDHAGGLTRFVGILHVVVPPAPQDQLPLLLVDDVFDHNSVAWPSAPPASLPLDNDVYRDAFWHGVLASSGGPANFVESRDVIDTETSDLGLRTLCNYRAVIWNLKYTTQGAAYRELQPSWDGMSEIMRHNWLGTYQRIGGNLLLAGSRATDAFHMSEHYALPVVYESTEGDPNGFVYTPDLRYRVGFGQRENPDGTVLSRFGLQYGYRDLGLSVIDQMSPNSAYVIYGSEPLIQARVGRKAACAAMKGLVVDDAFAALHAPALLDTIATEAAIDWRDLDPDYYDNLQNVYGWGDDEYYENPGDRATPFTYQICAEGPDSRCVEPMFRSLARFDWIRAQHLAADPNDAWPEGYYGVPMSQLCGAYALQDLDTAKTNGQVVGFLSHKTVATKPGGRADVVWGFDPYRLDHAAMTDAIRWVLGEHFGLTMTP